MRARITVVLCLSVALLEGIDVQSVGITGPRIAQEFSLSVAQLGWALSAGAIGLMPGALIGGRLADLLGRKSVLITSVVLFGLFSLATAHVWDFGSLLVARILTGLGLGAAMPILLALCSEAAAPDRRTAAVGAMYCGMPLGAAIGALIGVLANGPGQWRMVFYVGGFGPIAVALLLAFLLTESTQFESSRTVAPDAKVGFVEALWRDGRALMTSALWTSCLGTVIVLYFLMNWLPSMMIGRGLSLEQSGLVLMAFHIGAGSGSLGISNLMDRMGRNRTVIFMYAGMVLALATLAMATGALQTIAGGFLCGVFLGGVQSVLFALAGQVYPTHVRGTGIGAAVAVGRLGSILGPLIAGLLFSAGSSASMLVVSSIPVVIVAALGLLIVTGHLNRNAAAAGEDRIPASA
ncbi:3-(3-hydroxy-phenyl)propionate transporter MhpT [Pandoraea nosoerga]|uniref:3-(3-hydroxy-phenyl)propionate transporter MhpT n=2 Tax=Pandoraea nosoerga TaxID=2508296 RepID=A0A5E4W1A5_9BURK|nr:3-(3-hydroxy-phenyl)propionate transporter MhpT [Pandoraea nosoerga]